MSPDDVFGDEMNEPHDLDDAAAESLLAGTARAADPELADLLGDVRVAFTSTPPAVGEELAALIGRPAPVVRPFGTWTRLRSSRMAKIAAGVAAAVAATGGLAVAGALPAPVRHAIHHIGVGHDNPQHGHHEPRAVDNDTSTTMVREGTTSTTIDDRGQDRGDDRGGEVESEHANDDHGHGGPTPTTIEDRGDNGGPGTVDEGHVGSDDVGPKGGDTPTTVGTPPTTVDNRGSDGTDGGDHSGPGGGDARDGGDTSGSSGSDSGTGGGD
jgi:hypothetical protein